VVVAPSALVVWNTKREYKTVHSWWRTPELSQWRNQENQKLTNLINLKERRCKLRDSTVHRRGFANVLGGAPSLHCPVARNMDIGESKRD